MNIGDTVPPFDLPATDGTDKGPGATPTVVVFTCNHCPYALAWHDRLLSVARDYGQRAVQVLFVNPNDAERYPRDSFEAMKERVQADGGWAAAYLRDESQEVARLFGAKTTPDVFVLDAEGCCATAARPTPTTRIPRRRQPGCAGRSTRCWRAESPIRRRLSPLGAA